jgi:hypothetical protein
MVSPQSRTDGGREEKEESQLKEELKEEYRGEKLDGWEHRKSRIPLLQEGPIYEPNQQPTRSVASSSERISSALQSTGSSPCHGDRLRGWRHWRRDPRPRFLRHHPV